MNLDSLMDHHKDVVPALLVNNPANWPSAPYQAGAHLHKVREGMVQTIGRKVTQHSSLAMPGVNLESRKLSCFFSPAPGFAIFSSFFIWLT